MKKLILLLSMLLIFLLVACGSDANDEAHENDGADESDVIYEYDEHEYENYEEYIPELVYEYEEINDIEDDVIYEHEIDWDIPARIYDITELAAYYFGILQAAWDDDDGEMWGEPLHVPVALFCEETNMFAVNRPYARYELVREYVNGTAVYVGTSEETPWDSRFIYSYVDWDGQEGVFYSWQFLRSNYYVRWDSVGGHRNSINDLSLRNIAAIAHGGFHTLQQDLIGMRGATPPPLGSENAWISLMLEINALVLAFESNSDAVRLAAVHDALSIRHVRRYAYSGAGANENRIKLGEGTAVYTELHLILSRDEIMDTVRQWPEIFMDIPNVATAAIGYGYFGGALYGMLLDSFGVDWRHDVQGGTDLGLLLQEALGITEFIPLEDINLERYGYSEIVARVRG